jgi:hypothetical protein
VLEGEIGGDRPRLTGAHVLPFESTSQSPLSGGISRLAGEGILVVRSRGAICREVDLPIASDDEIRTMLALRLETELPYSPSEATWVHHRGDDTEQQGTARVLFIAVPTADVVAQQQELEASGHSCHVVESWEAALAQVAAAVAPGQQTAAIAEIETAGVMLVVAHNGKLTYARYISRGAAEPRSPTLTDAEARRLASEMHQSLEHYVFSKGASAPKKVLLAGERDAIACVAEAFERISGLTAEAPEPPDWLRVPDGAGAPKELLGRFASCVGALLAAHRRMRGEEPVAPPLRLPRTRFAGAAAHKRLGLAAASLFLIIALVVVSFGVRSAKLRAANRALEKAQSALADIEALEEEVKILRAESQRQRPAIDLLLALAQTMPDGILVGDLSIGSDGNVTIVGKAPSFEVASTTAEALSNSEQFADAKLQRASKENDDIMFRITCAVRTKGE